MLDSLKFVPEDPAELRAVSERLMAEVQSLTYQNENLKAELHGHRKARFGSKPESLDQLAFDLAEDAEAWLTWVLGRLPDHKANCADELMPWQFALEAERTY